MNRATALQVLSIGLIALLLAAGLPLAFFVFEPTSSSDTDPDATRGPGAPFPAGDLPFSGRIIPPDVLSTLPPGVAASLGGSAPWRTGAPLVDELLGAARSVHPDLVVPELPLAKLAPVDPLRPAILAWVAATAADVDPLELHRELARADALPQDLQRDLALLVLSAAEATLLQRQALALLTPEDVQWLYANADVAADLVTGRPSADAERLARLASLVDTTKSLQASLLLVQAVEATRGRLSPASASDALARVGDLDARSRALLQLLAGAADTGMGDADKVRFAAEVITVTTGARAPALPSLSFADATRDLLRATGQAPDPAALKLALQRAQALPPDLQAALAGTLVAQTRAIDAANPASFTPTGQAEALVGLLHATADALPVLEKHGLWWRQSPEALRVAQWSTQARMGWALEHAALLVAAAGDPVDTVRAAQLARGLDLLDPPRVPALGFEQAVAAVVAERGLTLTPDDIAYVRDSAARLSPAVREAATLMLSGAAESARLQREAYALLTPDEKAFLLAHHDLSATLLASRPTHEQLATAARIAQLESKVDARKLGQAELVGVVATVEARDLLAKARAVSSQSAFVRAVDVGWRAWFGGLFGSAAAQDGPTCSLSNEDGRQVPRTFTLDITTDCQNDVELRITVRTAGLSCPLGSCLVPAPSGYYDSGRFGSAEKTRFVFGDQNNPDILVITGPGTTRHKPPQALVFVADCPRQGQCSFQGPGLGVRTVSAVGSPTVVLDLGGKDQYNIPAASVVPGITLPVALHLDMGGDDYYADPSPLYDDVSLVAQEFGRAAGHPSQASVLGSGVAVLLEVAGDDRYDGLTRSQGYAKHGLALLVDAAGADTYGSRDFSHGAASESFNLGLGILLDAGGGDTHRVQNGGGYGVGGFSIDLGGDDVYVGDAPRGVPVVHLDILPGGDLATFHVRDDDRFWLDGPSDLSQGLGIDADIGANAGNRDGDLWSDFLEAVAGSDPDDPNQGIEQGPQSRAEKAAADADGDGFPDFMERALSTNEHDARSYPVSLPVGPTLVVGGVGEVTPGDAVSGTKPRGSDKVLDLRVPLQDAGTIDNFCTGRVEGTNMTDMNFMAGQVTVGGANNVTVGGVSTPGETGVPRNASSPTRAVMVNNEQYRYLSNAYLESGRCFDVSYAPSGPGQANASLPLDHRNTLVRADGQPAVESLNLRNDVTLRFPAGILAIGDSVATTYDVDYFYVIDLGGNDVFKNLAGGALGVRSGPGPGEEPLQNDLRRQAFLAPSFALSVDPDTLALGVVSPGGAGADLYETPARAGYAHGALYGLLVDTGGDDTYLAGVGSQGSQGGVLLDLAGKDRYLARDLSQGASLVSTPPAYDSGRAVTGPGPRAGVPDDGKAPATDAAARRSVPGALLDLGDGDDKYEAGHHSQGFARGYLCTAAHATCAETAVVAYGVLFDQSGKDEYTTLPQTGQNVQGAGTRRGVGLLFDRQGDDKYDAWGDVAHGATPSQTRATKDDGPSLPGAGILVDAGGLDEYRVADARGVVNRSIARGDNLTIHRAAVRDAQGEAAESHGAPSGSSIYVEPGIHFDGVVSPDSMDRFLRAVAGTGARDPIKADPSAFHVDIPTARLAIGDVGPTMYDREYALVVDLGGENLYNFTAAGFVGDVLASRGSAESPEQIKSVQQGARPTSHPTLVNLFPVSLLVDAGLDASKYRSPRPFSQGAGYFSVGVLADLGGNDSFLATPSPLATLGSGFATSPVNADGSLGATEWSKGFRYDGRAVGKNDSRASTAFTLRFLNDDDNLYVALEIDTLSNGSTGVKDYVAFDFNEEDSRAAFRADGTPAIDQARIFQSGCKKVDRHVTYNATTRRFEHRMDAPYSEAERRILYTEHDPFEQDAAWIDFQAGCAQLTGKALFEVRRPIRAQFPFDVGDIMMPWNREAGFTSRDIGFRLEFYEAATDETYVWPPGSGDHDGEMGHPRDESLFDEMVTWASLHLGNRGAAGVPKTLTTTPSFAQGSSVAGVGVLAMLGLQGSDAKLVAGDRSQGYGAFGGIGILVDAGGSDAYAGTRYVQGASGPYGFGYFHDAAGNDNYDSTGRSLGFAEGTSAALFIDSDGRDDYSAVGLPFTGQGALSLETLPPGGLYSPGNDRAWSWAGSSLGRGVDVLSAQSGSALVKVAMEGGTSKTNTVVSAVPYDSGARRCDPAAPIPLNRGKPLLNLTVCARAWVTIDEAAALAALRTVGLPSRAVTVERVDFLLDERRAATVTVTSAHLIASGTYEIMAPIDTRTFPDGVQGLMALPTFRVATIAAGPILYTEGIDTSIEEPAYNRVLVNNDPRLSLALSPTPEGLPTFSPSAAVERNTLAVNWSVTHDAEEDHMELTDGFRVPSWGRNVPCVPGSQERLCNVLPFWFTNPGDPQFNTTHDASASAVGGRHDETNNNDYFQCTPALQAPLAINRDEAFRVWIPDRTNIIDGKFTTTVTVQMLPNGCNRNGPVTLAERAFEKDFRYRCGTTSLDAVACQQSITQNNSRTLGQFAGHYEMGRAVLDRESFPMNLICLAAQSNLPGQAETVCSLEDTWAATLDPKNPSDFGWREFFLDVKSGAFPAAIGQTTDTIVLPAGSRLGITVSVKVVDGIGSDQAGGSIGSDRLYDTAYTTVVKPVVPPNCNVSADAKCLVTNLVGNALSPFDENNFGLFRDIDKNPLGVGGVSFFRYDVRSSDAARLEIRTPTSPTTRVKLQIEDEEGRALRDLTTGAKCAVAERVLGGELKTGRTYCVGTVDGAPTSVQAIPDPDPTKGMHYRYVVDAPGSSSAEPFANFSFRFDGRDDRGEPLPDGRYVARLFAKDAQGQEHNTSLTFRLDQTAPTTRLLVPEYASRAQATGVPLRWAVDEDGSGVNATYVWSRADTGVIDGNRSNWTFEGRFPASVTEGPSIQRTQFYLMAFSVDHAGNVEGLPRSDGLKLPLDAALDLAFLERFNASAQRKVVVDQLAPVAREPTVTGARPLAYLGVPSLFVRAGAAVTFGGCAADSDANGPQLATVNVTFDRVDPETAVVTSWSFRANNTGACADGKGMYAWSDWGLYNKDKAAFPDGPWGVQLEAYDRGGNLAEVNLGRVILDSVAPNLTAQPAIYPGAQVAADRGQEVRVRILAQDAYGVDLASLHVDASALSTKAKATVRPVKVGAVVYQEANFTVDKPGVADGVHKVVVRIADNAGNVNETIVDVRVDTSRVQVVPGSFRVTGATHNSVTLAWNTTHPASSQVKHGSTPLELRAKSALNTTPTTSHEIQVTGLAPSQRHFFRAVSVGAGGWSTESDTLDALTLTALNPKIVSPLPNAALRGAVPLVFQGGLMGSDDVVSYKIHVQSKPGAPWTLYTQRDAPGVNQSVNFNSTRFLDGDAYRIRVTAEAQGDVQSVEVGPLTVDNQAPLLTIVSPLAATNDTTPRIVAEARDALSGFDQGAARLRIDGVLVEGVVTERTGDRLRVTYDAPAALTLGLHTLQLVVVDRAGNEAEETWKVAIDAQPPTLAAQTFGYAPGPLAAKTGGTVTLNVSARDETGIARVMADVTGLSSAELPALVRVGPTDTYVATVPVTTTTEGPRRITITAIDLAGNERRLTVDVLVDNTPPKVGEARVLDVTHTTAALALDANEPISLIATATAPASPQAAGATVDPMRASTVLLQGLLPSRTYQYSLVAVDRAGNSVELSGRLDTALDMVAPSATGGVTIVDLLNGTLRLAWSPANDDVGVAYYRVYRSDDGSSFQRIAEVRAPTFDDRDLPLEKTFLYQVVAVDHGGNEGPALERIRGVATAVPNLTAGIVAPTVGTTGATFRYVVKYQSPGGVEPAYLRVVIDGVPQEMTRESGTPSEGATFVYETRLAPHKRDAPHTYRFEAYDGRYTVVFPQGDEPLRGPLVSPDEALERAGAFGAFAQRVPMAGLAGTAFALAAAAAAVALVARKKKEGSK